MGEYTHETSNEYLTESIIINNTYKVPMD